MKNIDRIKVEIKDLKDEIKELQNEKQTIIDKYGGISDDSKQSFESDIFDRRAKNKLQLRRPK